MQKNIYAKLRLCFLYFKTFVNKITQYFSMVNKMSEVLQVSPVHIYNAHADYDVLGIT